VEFFNEFDDDVADGRQH